jgi:hypothetical protein
MFPVHFLPPIADHATAPEKLLGLLPELPLFSPIARAPSAHTHFHFPALFENDPPWRTLAAHPTQFHFQA